MFSRTLNVADAIGLSFSEADFEQIDIYAANVKQRGPLLTPQVLAQKFLMRPYRRDLHKIRSIFIWLIQNILMDTDEVSLLEESDDASDQVLSCRTSRSSVGMANLFCDMAIAAGFEETKVVYGYLRGEFP